MLLSNCIRVAQCFYDLFILGLKQESLLFQFAPTVNKLLHDYYRYCSYYLVTARLKRQMRECTVHTCTVVHGW